MFTTKKQMIAFFNERKKIGIKPGLDRINRLLELLDYPQNKMKAIHVAGTNGKGSTISYLQHALMANGYKVGVYTSPSLDGLTGHIILNDKKITDDEFLHLLNKIHPSICKLDESGHHPTEYEILTALAFMYFADHVDIALIETAMGGREDTTNCFQPILSIITSIDKDHTAFLGETVQEIAYHKAGIIKDNTPVIVGDLEEAAFQVVQKEAASKQAQIYRLYEQFNYHSIQQINHKQVFTWCENQGPSTRVNIQMFGEHQVKNSSLALMALVYLKKFGCTIDSEKTLKGIASTRLPGRFEVIKEQPTIILDGAHNPAGVQSFLDTVDKNYQNVEKHLVFAGFKDKELDKMLTMLAPQFVTITLTSFDHPRAAEAEVLDDLVHMEKKIIINNWREAVDQINSQSSHNRAVYFITGSLHFIAMARQYLLNRPNFTND